ncbi:MAG: glycosyltransferase family 2 protein [Paracoccus sp. (in: a-proteobacteria)]|uniref:glycosyltransferase family 2 protein n=1 Tax=Paracoccus sp. TaxID=267 RepID=UPI0026E06CE4|nr:glycosyltransferase family 2 protein [Paracoccus sp. (in: a-proteobacteria)]MDO5611778.1 glycosyltransferase family 2 protein [Paracoccus sp. (in: a-proteobacteria)]
MRLSCIIPAYNEGPRVASVAQIAATHPGVAETLIVDDGSTDDTAAQAASVPGTRLIRQPRNAGKTAALAAGLMQARGSHILLLDADLIGLTHDHLGALIAPVEQGRAQVAISLRGNAPALWRLIGLDYISGERVLPRALIEPHIPRLNSLPPFGFEVFLNSLIIRENLPLAVIRWPTVASPLKHHKHGLWRGLRGDAGMIADMLRTHGPATLLNQIHRMRGLRN